MPEATGISAGLALLAKTAAGRINRWRTGRQWRSESGGFTDRIGLESISLLCLAWNLERRDGEVGLPDAGAGHGGKQKRLFLLPTTVTFWAPPTTGQHKGCLDDGQTLFRDGSKPAEGGRRKEKKWFRKKEDESPN